jgi:hypothetical protein
MPIDVNGSLPTIALGASPAEVPGHADFESRQGDRMKQLIAAAQGQVAIARCRAPAKTTAVRASNGPL